MVFRFGINKLKEELAFPMDFIFDFLFAIFLPFTLAFLWEAAGFKNSFEYFFAVFVSDLFSVGVWVSHKIDKEIRSGNFSRRLLYPVDIDLQFFFQPFVLAFTLDLLRAFVSFLVFYILFRIKIVGFLLILLDLPLIYALSFYLYFFFSVISIKTESSSSFRWIFRLIEEVLGGKIIPLAVLSTILGKILYLLPFRFIYEASYEIYKGNFSIIPIQVIYIVLFFLLSRIAWRRMLKRYEGYRL